MYLLWCNNTKAASISAISTLICNQENIFPNYWHVTNNANALMITLMKAKRYCAQWTYYLAEP